MRKIWTFLIIILLFVGCSNYGPKPIPSKQVKPLSPITLPITNAALSPKAASVAPRKVEIPSTNTVIVNVPSNTEAIIIKDIEAPVFQISNNQTNRLTPDTKSKTAAKFKLTFFWYLISTASLTVAWYLFGRKKPAKVKPAPQVERE